MTSTKPCEHPDDFLRLVDDARACGLLDDLAALEHEQWSMWAQAVQYEVGDERRKRWQKYFKPYKDLPEQVRRLDIEWAEQVLLVLLKHGWGPTEKREDGDA